MKNTENKQSFFNQIKEVSKFICVDNLEQLTSKDALKLLDFKFRCEYEELLEQVTEKINKINNYNQKDNDNTQLLKLRKKLKQLLYVDFNRT